MICIGLCLRDGSSGSVVAYFPAKVYNRIWRSRAEHTNCPDHMKKEGIDTRVYPHSKLACVARLFDRET